jgi:hypothetical protein
MIAINIMLIFKNIYICVYTHMYNNNNNDNYVIYNIQFKSHLYISSNNNDTLSIKILSFIFFFYYQCLSVNIFIRKKKSLIKHYELT